MFAAHRATRRDLIALGNGVLDDDFDVGKGSPELPEEGLETGASAQRFPTLVRQAVGDTVLSKHLVDCFFATLVPYLLKPSANEGTVSI